MRGGTRFSPVMSSILFPTQTSSRSPALIRSGFRIPFSRCRLVHGDLLVVDRVGDRAERVTGPDPHDARVSGRPRRRCRWRWRGCGRRGRLRRRGRRRRGGRAVGGRGRSGRGRRGRRGRRALGVGWRRRCGGVGRRRWGIGRRRRACRSGCVVTRRRRRARAEGEQADTDEHGEGGSCHRTNVQVARREISSCFERSGQDQARARWWSVTWRPTLEPFRVGARAWYSSMTCSRRAASSATSSGERRRPRRVLTTIASGPASVSSARRASMPARMLIT